jgi:FtsZ-interacting cell division protein ZipA
MTGTIVIIIVVIIVVAAIVAGVMYQRRRRLQQRFGTEYDRMVEQKGSKTKAEAELASRQRRVAGLDIRPLDPAARARYQENWAAVQEQFVDSPQEAVMAAQRLVMTVMQERGYPTEGGDQVLADLSVDHASVLDHYRAAYDISQRAADNQASTEDLRQAMIHYRALFQDLLGQTSTTADETPVTETTVGLPVEGDGAPAVGTGHGPGYPEPVADAGDTAAYPAETVPDAEPDAEPADEYDAEPATTGSDVPRHRRT